MLAKTHKTPDGRTILAICDTELIGKKFEEDGKRLDLTGEFYKGDGVDEIAVGDIMRNSSILNLVGKNTIAIAKKENLVEENHIITIQGVPHAQVVLADD